MNIFIIERYIEIGKSMAGHSVFYNIPSVLVCNISILDVCTNPQIANTLLKNYSLIIIYYDVLEIDTPKK